MRVLLHPPPEELGRRLELTTKFFRALGDPTRLRVLEHLLEGEKTVGELVELVGSGQGRVSSHLACLKQCGFVASRRDARFVYYHIADQRVRELLLLSQAMIADNAEQIWACTRVGASPSQEGEWPSTT